ncbi:WbqC family protein [Kitasatospora sp. NRRL B-11411]|uniref:WbqC family protein n=1 Tax=Kitasatospora sp. NRRL B-11411 TaxID=1463822 RepID=UPI001E547C36|nr:WbqC family protein [Kitasatospora sp. NRRL B-11411]
MVYAIHQPNFLPRLSTLAKLYAADVWVVLDDVQHARRDYQHRARLGSLRGDGATRWLSLPTRLPNGRATLIRDTRLADPDRTRRRVEGILHEQYRSSPFWPEFTDRLCPLLDLIDAAARTAEIAEASTLLFLDLLGWRGRVVRSSNLPAATERTQRLVDLCRAVNAGIYLCGAGGSRYVEPGRFTDAGVELRQFAVPDDGVWTGARALSAVQGLMAHGPQVVAGAVAMYAH